MIHSSTAIKYKGIVLLHTIKKYNLERYQCDDNKHTTSISLHVTVQNTLSMTTENAASQSDTPLVSLNIHVHV